MNSFKHLARSAIRKLVANSPWSVRDAILDGYLDHDYDVRADFGRVCRVLNITEIGADGDLGVMTGSPWDRSVILSYAKYGTGSKLPQEILKFFGHDSGTYIDAGANIGLTTVPIARNPRIRCLAFEPEPVNFGHLKQNVARNAEGASVEFYPVALFDAHSTMSMTISKTNLGDHRLTRDAVSDRRMIQVPAVPLDDFLDRVEGKLAVKVDTQGAEPFVVAGGKGVFARAGLIAMEFCPYLMRQLGGDPTIVMDLVAGFDRVAVTRVSKPGALCYVRPDEALAMLEHKLRTAADTDEDDLDILAVRSAP